MSELAPVPAGSVSLEDDESPTPAPPQVAPTAEPVAPAEPPPPADPDEANAVEIQGGKMVPVAVVKGVRQEVASAKQEAQQLRDQLAQQQQLLQTMAQLQRPAPAPEPAKPTTDPLAESYARQLDYYKADGTLDVDRGAKAAQLFREQAQQIAREQMQPLVQHTAQTQAEANFQWVLNTPAANGTKPSLESVKQLWSILPPQYTADRNIAQTLWTMAMGMDAIGAKKSPLPNAPAAPSAPPLVTEHTGPTRQRTTAKSEGTRLVMEARGMSEKKYDELTKDFQKGRASVLEED